MQSLEFRASHTAFELGLGGRGIPYLACLARLGYVIERLENKIRGNFHDFVYWLLPWFPNHPMDVLYSLVKYPPVQKVWRSGMKGLFIFNFTPAVTGRANRMAWMCFRNVSSFDLLSIQGTVRGWIYRIELVGNLFHMAAGIGRDREYLPAEIFDSCIFKTWPIITWIHKRNISLRSGLET